MDMATQATGNEAIYFKRGHGSFGDFSNFSEIPVAYNGLTYRTAEGAFQAQKTLDLNERLAFCNMDGKQAKATGRKVQLRPDWEQVKTDIMADIQYARILTDNRFKDLVFMSGTRLILEDTTGWRDNCWGCDFSTKPLGRNLLGICIMLARAKYFNDRNIVVCPIPFQPGGSDRFGITEQFKILTGMELAASFMGNYYNVVYYRHAYIR